MAEPLRLYGLKALVTSAGSGIGEAVARTLVKHGAHVLAADGLNSGVEQTFKSVRGIDGLAMSLTDSRQMPMLVESAVEKLGGLDILINEFPLQPPAPIEEKGSDLDDLLKLRTELVLSLCRAALPHIKKSPAGRIINVGFLRSVFAAAAGSAREHAEKNLADVTRALAVEIGEFGINANFVQPGAIMTASSREVFRKDTQLRDHCIAGSAARRLGEPVDVAKVVLFLASDEAVFVSGTGIAVDGGRTTD